MKILRYFSYAILALFVLFVLIGQIFGNVSYSSEVTINQPVAYTWDVFTDDKKMAEWVPGFRSIELVSGQENQEGAVYKMRVMDGGEVYETTEKVIESQREKKYVFELENDVMINLVSYEFSETPERTTHIVEKQQLRGKDFLMKPIFVFMKSYLHSQAKDALGRFKTMAES